MPDIERAFIVTDATMVKLGYVDHILYLPAQASRIYCHSEIYSDVEPDPDVSTITQGCGGHDAPSNPTLSSRSAAVPPSMRQRACGCFTSIPEASFDGLRLKFLDIRKRAYKFPRLGEKAKLVAIPTTSGTGSEVTAFTVITDRQNGNVKYPLADYAVRPDVAIIDPQFVWNLPKAATARHRPGCTHPRD